MKNITIIAILSILLISMLSITFNIALIKAETTIYIRADGSVGPPTAPIKRQGDVYTFTANISESIVVQKNNAVVDGKGYALEGDGTGNGFDLSNMKNITIKNARISKFSAGIRLSYSAGATLVNNTITKCVYGILPSNSPSSTMINNTITNNDWDGIFLTYSDGSILRDNTIANHNKWGLYLGSSTGIILRNNKIIGNRWNFAVSDKYIHDIDTSNTVDGKPIYYLVNQRDKEAPANSGYVGVINSANITIRNLNLTNNGQGVVLVNSKNCLIENSAISKMGYYGIQLFNADDNTISDNNITDNKAGYVAGYLVGYFGVGIAVQSDSTGNTIRNNLIKNNEQGILFYKSEGNTIYHNNFVGNSLQAFSNGSKNAWDNGYPSGGNYWSNYAGEDDKSGSDQDKPGNDGIGDKPYIIDAKNQDRYPFISMVPKVGGNASISVDPTWVSTGIATITAVAVMAYLVRARMRVDKKLEAETTSSSLVWVPRE